MIKAEPGAFSIATGNLAISASPDFLCFSSLFQRAFRSEGWVGVGEKMLYPNFVLRADLAMELPTLDEVSRGLATMPKRERGNLLLSEMSGNLIVGNRVVPFCSLPPAKVR